ncbi:MAG: helix-turn-helix domain-containing protein [Candidatus Izemoplasmatales bacterium]|jgi:transcriptional regulator with XRE-family HTH domain|nr:helix-turn-helix domain-containing protein [Candidatus Izemoplasmatales bacterium]
MNADTVGINIKKLREENQITQQQLADSLGISFQAVSKWECGNTLPDIGILPQIAEFFNVTIDELFQSRMTVYQNRAGRLSALYESDIHDSEIYEKAEKEYLRLLQNDDFDERDIFGYAYLHDLRHRYHSEVAEKYYLEAISLGSKIKDEFYYKIQRQYMYLLSTLGRSNENIENQTRNFESDPNNQENHILLLCAYIFANENKKAYELTLKALDIFPNNGIILTSAGDVAQRLNFYDKAIKYWNLAFEINPELIDTRYSLVSLLSEQGKNEEAIKELEEIILWNNDRGFEIENKWVMKEIAKLKRD